VDAGTELIDRPPDTRFIIDHLAILQTPPAPPQPWVDLPKVLELAKRQNAVIKVSGACTLSREPYPFPDIWDPLARVLSMPGGSTAACGARTGHAHMPSSTTSRPSSLS
jgi:L-fuconolactonase